MSEATIFATALEKHDPAERAAYLDRACAGDAVLRRRVEELLAVHDRAADYLERPAVEQLTAEGGLDFLQPSDRPGALGRIDGYEVEEVLSRSPFGVVVVKAFDTRLHRVVAIKLLTAAVGGSAGRRFLREARAAAAVRDDHVVAPHAVVDGPVPYLVMEYIAGQTLQQKLDRNGPLELHEVLRIGVQIARGLAAIHAQGLIHRDLKPANILLENGIERVKITDFGLARAVDDANVSQAGTVAGTPTYMSPEQAQGVPVDPRSDLFSLGSVLYALCTGRPPFRAADTLAVLRRVVEDVPRPVRAVNSAIPAWLSDLIARLHAKRAADRPQSAREVADLLAQHLAALQLPGSAATSPLPMPRRRRRWVAAAVVLLALAAVGMTEATGVTQLGGTVIRLFDAHGTLVVETDDPDVSVTVDGQEIIIRGAGPREVRLRAGEHEVETVKDGVRLDTEKVVIERGGKVIVRAHRERPPNGVPPPPAKKAAVAPAPAGAVTAAALIEAMRGNAATYTGRHVVVTGRMLRITGGDDVWDTIKGWGQTYLLEMGPAGPVPAEGSAPRGTYLLFYLFTPRNVPSPLAKLKAGELVTVEGDCTGWWPKEPKAGEWPHIAFAQAKLVGPAVPEPPPPPPAASSFKF